MNDIKLTDEELLAERDRALKEEGLNFDSLDSRMSAAYKGEIGSFDPMDFSPSIQQYRALESNPVVATSDEGQSALLTWGTEASREAFKSIEGGMIWLTRNLMDVEEGYNPYTDEYLQSEGEDFISRNAKMFADSPSSAYTRGMIEVLKKQERDNEALRNGGEAALWGQITGLLVDPTNFIPIYNAARAGKAAGFFGNVASGAVQTGGVFAGSEVLRRQADPNITDEESLYSTLVSVGMGGALFGLAGALSAKESANLGKIITDTLETTETPKARREFMNTVDKVATDLQTKSLAELDLAEVGKENLGIAKTNWLYSKVQKGASYFIPEQRLLNSESGITRAIINRLAPHNTILEGNLKGIATRETITNRIETSVANSRVKLDNLIDEAYTIHRRNGGDLTKPAFMIEARDSIITRTTSADAGVDTLAKGLRKYYDEFIPTIKASGKMPEDWVPKDNFFHYEWSFSRIMDNQAEVVRDIMDELIKEQSAAGKLVTDTRELQRTADDILADMIRTSQGAPAKDSYKASGLRARTLNFSDAFVTKYLSNDVYGSTIRYVQEIQTETELRRLFGLEGNIYDNAQKLIKEDYDKLRFAAVEAGDNARLKKLTAAEESDKKDVVNLIDILTGRNIAGTNRTLRTIAALAKGWSYMKAMGSATISQIPDFARLMGLKVFKGKFGAEMKDVIGEVVNTFKLSNDKDGARRLGIIADELLSTNGTLSRAGAIGDLGEGQYLTKGERITRVATNAFSKINLMDPMNNFTREIAASDAAKNILVLSNKLVKGTLKKGSLEEIELAKLGVDKQTAEKFIKEFEVHKRVEEKWGGKVVFSNYQNWESETQLKFASMIRRSVDNTIVQKTLGSQSALLSTPIGSVISQFKGFMIASQSKVLLPGLQRIAGMGAESTAQVIKVVLADLMLASLSGTVRDFVMGREVDLSPERLILHAFDRSAIMSGFSYPSAILDKFGVGVGALLGEDGSTKFRNVNVLEALMGPTAGAIQGAADVSMRFTDGKITDKDMEQLIRQLPGQNLLWWAWAVNKISE